MCATASLQTATTRLLPGDRVADLRLNCTTGAADNRSIEDGREEGPVPPDRPTARDDASVYFGIFGPFQPGFSWVVPAAQGTLTYFMSLPEKPSGLHG